MQYPSHLILDFQQSTLKSKTYLSWPQAFLEKTKKQNKHEQTTYQISKVNILRHNSEKYDVLRKKVNNNNSKYYQEYLNFNINFLRKERLYTKLKYSRCPQYDIVSGGWAALFAGLIGFLISEKFGIELVDSGDFYNALMYIIFLVFALRPLIRIMGKNFTLKDLIILKDLLYYLQTLNTIILLYIKEKKKKLKSVL